MLESPHTTGPVTRAIAAMRGSATLTTKDLSALNGGEPRVMDLRLAEALGFGDHHKIRALIERHRAALERFGEVSATVAETTKKGGRPGKTFWLTKKQALYLCTKSETALATEVTIEVVEVFDAVTSSAAGTMVAVDQRGMAVFRIGGRLVMADTTRWRVLDEKAVVMTYDGRLKVERATYDASERSPWMGARFGYGPWKKSKPGQSHSSGRSGLWIIGAVIEAALGRTALAVR